MCDVRDRKKRHTIPIQCYWSMFDGMDLSSKMTMNVPLKRPVNIHVILFMLTSLSSIYLLMCNRFCLPMVQAKVKRWRKKNTEQTQMLLVVRFNFNILSMKELFTFCWYVKYFNDCNHSIWNRIINTFPYLFIFSINIHSKLHTIWIWTDSISFFENQFKMLENIWYWTEINVFSNQHTLHIFECWPELLRFMWKILVNFYVVICLVIGSANDRISMFVHFSNFSRIWCYKIHMLLSLNILLYGWRSTRFYMYK